MVQEPKEKKKYFCGICKYSTDIKCNYETHLESKRHKVLEKKLVPPEESFYCASCGITLRDKTAYERHTSTKKHEFLLDASKDLPKDKLEHIVSDVVLYIVGGQMPQYDTNTVSSEKSVKPRNLLVNTGTESVLMWMKETLEPINHRITERDGCSFVWPNKRYILSRKDFAYFVVSASSKILRSRIESAKKEAERLTETGERASLGLGNFNEAKFNEDIDKRLSTITEGTTVSRALCDGYWFWWVKGKSFREERNKLSSSLFFFSELPSGVGACSKPMEFEKFVKEVKKMRFTISGETLSKNVQTLCFLEKLDRLCMEEMSVASREGIPSERCVFVFSLRGRISLIHENLFLSHFGFTKKSQMTKRTEEIISSLRDIG